MKSGTFLYLACDPLPVPTRVLRVEMESSDTNALENILSSVRPLGF